MAALSTQQADAESATGVVLSGNSAAGGGDTITNDGRTCVLIDNQNGASVDVTAVTVEQRLGTLLDIDDYTVSVANGALVSMGPFNQTLFGTTVSFTYSATSGVTVYVYKI